VHLTAVEVSQEVSRIMYSGPHRAGIVPRMHMLHIHPLDVWP
jgi:hypothetical protein